jgi:hypothetical protein
MKPIVVLSAHCEPLPTSAASIMCDLAESLTVDRRVFFITQAKFSFGKKCQYGTVFGIKNPFIKSQNHHLRFLGEIIFPILLAVSFGLYCRFIVRDYDVVAYSPTALQFPLMGILKQKNTKQVLILRDIFPGWMADAKIFERESIVFKVLDKLSSVQYSLSNVIAVQCAADIDLLKVRFREKCVVLNSFFKNLPSDQKSIKKINLKSVEVGCFGTFGLAQGWQDAIKDIDLILLKHRNVHISFFGSNNKNLEKKLFSKKVRDRVKIGGAIRGDEFSNLIKKMDIGFFSLADEINGSNIPGKFIDYCKYGLPTFALCNLNSHIAKVIRDNRLGYVSQINDSQMALANFSEMLANYELINKENIYRYFESSHSVNSAKNDIYALLS